MPRPIRVDGFAVWLDLAARPTRTTPREFAARVREYLRRMPRRPTF